MRIPALLTALAAGLFLTACDEKKSCTEEQAMQKLNEVGMKFQTALLTQPERMEELTGKFEEVMTRPMNGEDQASELCQAMDDLLEELG